MIDLIEMQKAASQTLGFDLSKVEQGTDEWHRSRSGVMTASNAYKLLMKASTQGRQSYVNELVSSVCTGLLPDEIKAKPLAWGKENEEFARDAYSAATFEIVTDTGFIYKDEHMRAGCSPDGLIMDNKLGKGLELKSPWSSAVYVDFAALGNIKKEEVAQVQFSLWITGYHSWAFAKFDPRMANCKKLAFTEIFRDEQMIADIEGGYNQVIESMDKMLGNLGVAFGQQWRAGNA